MRKKEPQPPDRHIAQTAKRIVVNCFRNTALENFHAGSGPVTRTGDYSDVIVIDGDGTEWAWKDCSHIDDVEMKALMQDCVGRVYTYLKCMDDEDFQASMRRYDASTARWDRPQLSRNLLGSALFERIGRGKDKSG